MKARWLRRLLLGLSALLLLTPALTAQAAEKVEHYKIRGNFGEAWGEYATSEAEGTLYEFLVLEYRDNSDPGKPITTTRVEFVLAGSNQAPGSQHVTLYGHATISPDDFKMRGNLRSATFDTTVTAWDEGTGKQYDVDISIVWEGTGDVYRERSRSRVETPESTFIIRHIGTERSATAWLSVSSDVLRFSNVPIVGVLAAVKEGSVTIERK